MFEMATKNAIFSLKKTTFTFARNCANFASSLILSITMFLRVPSDESFVQSYPKETILHKKMDKACKHYPMFCVNHTKNYDKRPQEM